MTSEDRARGLEGVARLVFRSVERLRIFVTTVCNIARRPTFRVVDTSLSHLFPSSSSARQDTVKCIPLAGAMGIALVCFFPFSPDACSNRYRLTSEQSTTRASRSARYCPRQFLGP